MSPVKDREPSSIPQGVHGTAGRVRARSETFWALLEADERNKNALPPDLWVLSLRQAAIEGGVSVRFQSLVTMELAVTDAMWHGHAGIDKWIGLVCTESKIDQNKIASDVASKLNQHHRP
jgi:hypothetical protein